MSGMWRSRWAAMGAAVAITLGGGGLGIVQATTSSGEKPIYVPINPCRLADTRPAPDTVGVRTTPVGAEESYTLSGWGVVGDCTLPAGTAGLALNVTAVDPTDPTYLTLYPTGASLPTTSNLNPWPGQPPTPNAVNVDLNGSGRFDVFNKYGSVHVIVDVVGYFDDHNHDDIYYRKGDVDTALGAKANKTDVDAALAALFDAQYRPMVISAADFRYDGESYSGGYFYDFDTGRLTRMSGCFQAPVQLPIGATIDALTFFIFDNDLVRDLSVDLRRAAIINSGVGSSIASGSSAGSSTSVQAVSAPVSTPVVDINFNYFVTVCDNSGSSTLGVDGVAIHLRPPS